MREIEYVDYIKEETLPVTHKITGLLSARSPRSRASLAVRRALHAPEYPVA